MAFSKAIRENAKNGKTALVSLTVNLNYCDGPGGTAEIVTQLPKDKAKKLLDLCTEYYAEFVKTLPDK